MVKFLFPWLAVVLACGCGKDGIKVYTIPKEPPAQIAEANLPAGHPDTSATGTPKLKWQLPVGWQEVPAGDFRVASFRVTGPNNQHADVSVIPLPGEAGGDFSNVNRWRGQVGLSPVSEEELPKRAQPVELAGQPAQLYDQAGESSRILAVIQRRDGTSWFFKMTGDPVVVAQEKPAFIEFLKSIQFGSSTDAGGSKWTTPSDWKEVPGGQFLVAKFVVADEGGAQAAVNVSSSPGDGGGLVANVNRWRKQLGLNELSADELSQSVQTIGDRATLVELSGQSAALVGVIVLQPERAWFYKLMGDSKIVAVQKNAFIKFVQGVKY